MSESSSQPNNKALSYLADAQKLNPEDNYSPEAEQLLNKALKIDETLVDAWTALGYTYYNKGDPAKALSCFDKAVKFVCLHIYIKFKKRYLIFLL